MPKTLIFALCVAISTCASTCAYSAKPISDEYLASNYWHYKDSPEFQMYLDGVTAGLLNANTAANFRSDALFCVPSQMRFGLVSMNNLLDQAILSKKYPGNYPIAMVLAMAVVQGFRC